MTCREDIKYLPIDLGDVGLSFILILKFRGQSSPDVPFLFVSVQNLTNLNVKGFAAFGQSNLQVFVDG